MILFSVQRITIKQLQHVGLSREKEKRRSSQTVALLKDYEPLILNLFDRSTKRKVVV